MDQTPAPQPVIEPHPPTPTLEPNISTAPFSNKRWLHMAIATILLGLVIVSIYAYQAYLVPSNPTKSQTSATSSANTANWKTYHSDKYGFSFKFPDNYGCKSEVKVVDPSDPNYSAHGWRVNPAHVVCSNSDYYLPAIPFSLVIYAKESADDPGLRYGETQISGNLVYKLASTQNVTKSGISGTRWEYDGGSAQAPVIYYYFRSSGLAYAITINGNGFKPNNLDVTALGETIYQSLNLSN